MTEARDAQQGSRDPVVMGKHYFVVICSPDFAGSLFTFFVACVSPKKQNKTKKKKTKKQNHLQQGNIPFFILQLVCF